MLKTLETAEIQLVSLEEIKTHLRLEHCEEDQYLIHLIQTATDYIENYLNRSLIIKKYMFVNQGIKRNDNFFEIRIPKPNIINIESIFIIRGNVGRFLVKRYQLQDSDISPKLIVHKTEDEFIEIIYQAGYGYYPKNVPSPIRHSILEIVSDLYENRGTERIERSDFYKNLLKPYRVMEVV
jgi:uncharacterized phiE125 gp8 family phage protein